MPDRNDHQEDNFSERDGEPDADTGGEDPLDETSPEAGSEAGAEPPELPEPMGAAFFHEVMSGLSDTNFARGWTDASMYHDFLAWCESSDEADEIIARYSPLIPSLLVDPEDNVRFVSLHANVAAELMRALLEAYEQRRIEEFLAR